MSAYGGCIFTLLQSIYLAAFWYFYEKKGFRLKWFIPLALGIIAGTFLVMRRLCGQWLPADPGPQGELSLPIITAIALVVIYPVHAVLTVVFFKLLKVDNFPLIQRLIYRGVIYITATMITGLAFAFILAIIFALISPILR